MPVDETADKTAAIPDVPDAILRPITDEERQRHVWFTHPSTTTAVLCSTPGCGAWLAALATDSVGTLHLALIYGRKERMPGWWRVWQTKKKRGDLQRYDRMAQVPLSGRPGRLKLLCPVCYRQSKIVVPRPPRRNGVKGAQETA